MGLVGGKTSAQYRTARAVEVEAKRNMTGRSKEPDHTYCNSSTGINLI